MTTIKGLRIMGDWEDFCDSHGMGMDWEPWNSPGWGDNEDLSKFVDIQEKARRKKNYKELVSFLHSVKSVLRLSDIKILHKKKNGIEVYFESLDVRIKYTHSYYRNEKSFSNVKENILTLLILHYCNIDIVKEFSLEHKNNNIEVVDVISLKKAGEIYIHQINSN
ncbi:hypothetical protein AB4383_06370 [Vibrio breoganii]